MKKKALSLCLALMMCLSLFPLSALAADYTEVIPCKYDEVHDFSEGLAAVALDGKWGFIDKTGKEVIPCKYDNANDFSEGLAAVCVGTPYEGGKWGFIDKTGKEVIPCKYDGVGDFSEGLAVVINVMNNDLKCGFIDKTGKEVVPCKYDQVGNFSEGLAVVRVGDYETGKYGFIDKTGKEVVPCKYDDVTYFGFSEGLAAVKLNGKWGFIDKTGKEVVPCKYDDAEDFSEGLARVKLDGKWGFISVDVAAAPTVPTQPTAAPSTQTVNVDGKTVTFEMYALGGGSTNYIRVRDLAAILNGTAAQFQVGWDGNVTLTTKTAYDGSSDKAPFNTDMTYTDYTEPTYVDGATKHLEAIQIAYEGGGYTYYKLRDLGEALGFNVGWDADKGVFIETNKPYDASN